MLKFRLQCLHFVVIGRVYLLGKNMLAFVGANETVSLWFVAGKESY